MSRENSKLLFKTSFFVNPSREPNYFAALNSLMRTSIQRELLLSYLNSANTVAYLNNAYHEMEYFDNSTGSLKKYVCFDTGLKTYLHKRILVLTTKDSRHESPYFLGFYPEDHHLIKEHGLNPRNLLSLNSGKYLLENFNSLTFKNVTLNEFPDHAYKRIIEPRISVEKDRVSYQSPNERYIEEYSKMEKQQFITLINDGINCARKGIEKPIYGIYENKGCMFIKISFPLNNGKEYEGYLAFSEDTPNTLSLKTYLSKNMVKGWALFNDLNNAANFSIEKINENEHNKIDSLNSLKEKSEPEVEEDEVGFE
ncbi:MAG: hypothetical protein MJ214_02385 [Bacilli bacterium]|nr:hypothetical protein [Bacilli bacterium]